MTQRYGILAYPAAHSLSPILHNTAFKIRGLDAQYERFEVAPADFDAFMQKIISGKEQVNGLSVSLPYKEKIVPYLDTIDEEACAIGAVNTVVVKDGSLHGFNTDMPTSMGLLRTYYRTLKNKSAVILGAGGAARALAYGLLRSGANVVILNRTREKADAIAIEFAEQFQATIRSDTLDNLYTGDMLIHTTSLWHEHRPEDPLPAFCDPEYLKQFELVMDIAYIPRITPLIFALRKTKVHFITGLEMLVAQAGMQFEAWTGVRAPFEEMRVAAEDALR